MRESVSEEITNLDHGVVSKNLCHVCVSSELEGFDARRRTCPRFVSNFGKEERRVRVRKPCMCNVSLTM
jgi:hypothetical protein